MYYREVRHPTPDDIQLIDYASRIAGLAIERERSQSALTLALETIRKSEAQLKQIVDVLPHGIAVLDPDGKAIYANQWLLDYCGLSLDEILARDFRTTVFHPEDIDRVQDERRRALARGLPFENEQRALGKDGKYRWFLIRYNPLRDEQGRILRWYATGTDIDDRKQVEERMRKENLALREEIDRSSMYEEIVGSSAALRSVISQVNKVAPTDSTVMIFGETGTGKELIASAIHKRSKRAANEPFIGVNCAAIPPSLIASELFGHEKGALPGRFSDASAASNPPMVERSSSTRSANSHPRCRLLCCGYCKNGNSSGSGAANQFQLTCECSPPQTGTLKPL